MASREHRDEGKGIVHLKVRKEKPKYSFIFESQIRPRTLGLIAGWSCREHCLLWQQPSLPESQCLLRMRKYICHVWDCQIIGKYYHPTSKQTVFCVVDKGEACGEVNRTWLLALSLSLPGLTVQLSLRGLSSPRPAAYHPDKLTLADRRGRWSSVAGVQVHTYNKTGTPGSDHCSVDSS